MEVIESQINPHDARFIENVKHNRELIDELHLFSSFHRWLPTKCIMVTRRAPASSPASGA